MGCNAYASPMACQCAVSSHYSVAQAPSIHNPITTMRSMFAPRFEHHHKRSSVIGLPLCASLYQVCGWHIWTINAATSTTTHYQMCTQYGSICYGKDDSHTRRGPYGARHVNLANVSFTYLIRWSGVALCHYIHHVMLGSYDLGSTIPPAPIRCADL